MVKAKVGGGKRYAAKALASSDAKEKAQRPGPPPPKHLQRKIARKVQFLEKVKSTTQPSGGKAAAHGLGVKAGIVKKKSKTSAKKTSKALDSLAGSLAGVLDEVQRNNAEAAEGKQPRKKFGEAVKSGKARSAIMVQESARIQQVLQHPAFKANPLAAIKNHLAATLPAAPPPASKGAGAAGQKKGAKRKTAKSQKSSNTADMVE